MALNLESKFIQLYGAASAPVLDAIALDQLDAAQDVRPELFNIQSMDREITQWTKLSTLGVMDQVGEGELINKDTFTQLGLKTFTALKFGKSIGISAEMMDDARFDLINRMVKSLGRSAFETQMLAAMNIYNNGFSSETSFDGVAIFSASHPTQTGNQSNLIASAADISYAGLKEGENYFRKLTDERGKRLMSVPSVVLVTESFRHDALELINSPFKPGSANNDINSLSQLKVVSNNWLTDDDAWFMQCAPSDPAHGMMIYNRNPLETRTHEDERAQVLYYIASYRQALGNSEWRGTFASAGI